MKTGIVFDTETTDLLPPNKANIIYQPFITEIYMGKFDLKTYEIVDELNTLIGIPVKLEDHIIKITGITDEMLETKDDFSVWASRISEFCVGSHVVVGHNLMFDLGVLRKAFLRYEQIELYPEFEYKECTVELSYTIQKKRLKLSQLYKLATGMVHEGAHRAKADVFATLECYKWLMKNGF